MEVAISEETYLRMRAAEASLAEAVARAERAERKASDEKKRADHNFERYQQLSKSQPAAAVENPVEMRPPYDPVVASEVAKMVARDRDGIPPHPAVAGSGEALIELTAEVSRLKGELERIYKFCDGQLAEAQRNALSPYHRGCEVTALAVFAAKHSAALQKPEGEPQTESE